MFHRGAVEIQYKKVIEKLKMAEQSEKLSAMEGL